jgi:hypothetical protein
MSDFKKEYKEFYMPKDNLCRIIESFGTGIGEAKRSMRENSSPELFLWYNDRHKGVIV